MCTYFMFRRKYSSPEIGTYYSYEIAVYGHLFLPPVRVIRDVSPNAGLVAKMITEFNRNQLPPDQLEDAIIDFFDRDLSLK